MPHARTLAAALSAKANVAVCPTDTVVRAAVLMAEANCGSALVLLNGAIVGLINERDILMRIVARNLDPMTTPVDSVMRRRPVCAHAEMSVPHALYTMKELGFRHFPVIGSGDKPLGVFSPQDAFFDELLLASDLVHSKEKIAKAPP